MSKGQCFSGLLDALEELHTDTYLSLHRICFFAFHLQHVTLAVASLVYACTCIYSHRYYSVCSSFVNSRAALVPGSTQHAY